jgi:hypothetical protein
LLANDSTQELTDVPIPALTCGKASLYSVI